MPHTTELKSNCTACGLPIAATALVCPHCGVKLGGELKHECPFCGELILKGTTKCPSCLLSLKGYEEKVAEKTVEEMTDQLLDEIIAIESDKVKREGKHLACPGCHWLLDGDEGKCPKCGRTISSVSDLLCPICASPVGSNLDECSRCGAKLSKGYLSTNLQKGAPREVSLKPEVALDNLLNDFSSMVPCPKCGVLARPAETSCSKCGSSMSPEQTESVIDRELAAELPVPETESTEVEEALEKLGQIEKQSGQPKKTRKLRNGKVTKVLDAVQVTERGLTNGVGQINGSGLTNGTGRINGVGRVNGTGLTNGQSLVNGTGASNGIGGTLPSRFHKSVSNISRLHFLAVLVAIVVLLASLATLSYLKGEEGFSADGDFGEWASAPMYGASVQSSSPSIDILEWSVAAEFATLYFYVEAPGAIMGSSEAQSFYLFVDADGSSGSGYLVSSIGAEYMLQVDGWDGIVQSASWSSRSSGTDQCNWSQWAPSGILTAVLRGSELEAEAYLGSALGEDAKYLLMSKNSLDDSAIGHVAPASGGLLIITQSPSADVLDDGIVPAGASVLMLNLTITCEGSGGTVTSILPHVEGAQVADPIGEILLELGEEQTVAVALDTSAVSDGEMVSAEMLMTSVESTFGGVEILGEGASAYVGSPPSSILIDGAFADWSGRTFHDQDSAPVAYHNVDIVEFGNVNLSGSSFFFVGVSGDICSGTSVPAKLVKPSGSGGGGGGVIVRPRVTSEDFTRIFIDSDKSSSTGFVQTADSKTIGADHMVEVRGLHGAITGTEMFDYVSGDWSGSSAFVEVAKDKRQMELSVSSSDLNDSSDIDFIVEMTTWNGVGDSAAIAPDSVRAFSATFSGGFGFDDWPVDGSAPGRFSTAMSYQRKLFHDGTNFWSFYFDGRNTVHKYSTDNGVSWTRSGTIFKTEGVNETSIWYDPSNNLVYAVGDTSSASKNVTLQKGTVNPSTHNISWDVSDSLLAVSSNDLAGKNSFVSRDANGFIWVLASNCSQAQPVRYDLTAFKSIWTNSITSWAYSGQMLSTASVSDSVKGSVVPGGSGSDVWAVYTYSGVVASRKYTGSWQTPQTVIYTGGGSSANTDNSPPSVVVDSKGVVHVVYGTGRKTGQSSVPSIEYSKNNTGATTFTTGVDLDASIPTNVGDYYPTITLDSSTGNLLVFWLRSDTSLTPITVTARKCASGVWSDVTISGTSYAKQFLTSIYSVSSEASICWEWTQNTTAPFEVMFDLVIPEFSHLGLPLVFAVVVFVARASRARRGKA